MSDAGSTTRRSRQLVRPPRAGDPEPDAAWDGSVWSLILVNLAVLGFAAAGRWDARELMLAYWAQSVIIGIANVFRILSLERFSTENFTINDAPVEPTPATKVKVASFFALHYGVFHAGYLMFLVLGDQNPVSLGLWFWMGAAAFAINHFWSYRYNIEMDRQGTPNIGTLMATPYIRIVPMHLTIILGGMLAAGSSGTLLLFGGLKTAADVGMHLVEHGRLKRTRYFPPFA